MDIYTFPSAKEFLYIKNYNKLIDKTIDILDILYETNLKELIREKEKEFERITIRFFSLTDKFRGKKVEIFAHLTYENKMSTVASERFYNQVENIGFRNFGIKKEFQTMNHLKSSIIWDKIYQSRNKEIKILDINQIKPNELAEFTLYDYYKFRSNVIFDKTIAYKIINNATLKKLFDPEVLTNMLYLSTSDEVKGRKS